MFYFVIPVLVHNQCSYFELVSPVCFGHNAIWIRSPDQKVDANTMTDASFGIEIFKTEFASALVYKLQRKKQFKSNDQTSVDNISTEDSSTNLQLLVIWNANEEYRYCVRALLIKHSNTITWYEDTLEKLHSMHLSLCRSDDVIEDTWLLDDVTALTTTSKWEEESRTFEITLSEGTIKDDSREPLWVSSSM
jgi:hypothetical protein